MNPEFLDDIVVANSIPVPNYGSPIYDPTEKAVCLAILTGHIETGFHLGSEPYQDLKAIVRCAIDDMQVLSHRSKEDLESLILETTRDNPEWYERLNDPQ